MQRNTWGLFVFLTAGLFSLAQAQTIVQPPQAVTAPAIISESAGGPSYSPVFSEDGRYLAFISAARNLVTNDDARVFLNVYVRELATGNTRLASVNVTGVGGGNADSTYPMISSNGQYVFFVSSATDLEANHANASRDLFVRDMLANTTRSLHPTMVDTLWPMNVDEEITPNGLYGVAASTNVSASANILLYDYVAGTNELISINTNGLPSNNCQAPEVSGDGRYVAFTSTSTNLVPLTNVLAAQQVYIRDRQSQTTICPGDIAWPLLQTNFSANSALFSANARYVLFVANASANNALIRFDLQTAEAQLIESNKPSIPIAQISADGRFVAYKTPSEASGMSKLEIHIWDAQTSSNILVNALADGSGVASGNFDSLTLSRDGQRIAFTSDSTSLPGGSANSGMNVYVYDLPTGAVRLVTTNRDGSIDPDMDASSPVISPDGASVAYVSGSSRLVEYDLNQSQDVFFYSIDTGATELVSRRARTLPSATASGLVAYGPSSISADGRYVAFAAYDGNLVPGDTNGYGDIFVRDTFTGKTVIASTDSNGTLNTNNSAFNPQVSADGKRVLFSRMTLLQLQSQIPGSYDLFFKNIDSGVLTVIASNLALSGHTPSGANYQFASDQTVSMSSDASNVVFQTSSSLVTKDANGYSDIYLWNGTTNYELLSVGPSGSVPSDHSMTPVISPDGQWVVFQSYVNNLGSNTFSSGYNFIYTYARNLTSHLTHAITNLTSDKPVFCQISANSRYVLYYQGVTAITFTLHDLLSQQNVFIGTGYQKISGSKDKCYAPSTVSGDGKLIAYCSGTTNKQIYVVNTQTMASNLVSVASDGVTPGSGDSTMPVITPEGRFVFFSSTATNLLNAPASPVPNIYARDLSLGLTFPLTHADAETTQQYPALWTPLLSGDGRTVVLRSFTSATLTNDFNASRDLIILRFGTADSDGDGMDDNWELAYFGTLSRDGTGDSDGDGISDLDEFRAGTDPTNKNSTMRVLPVTTSNAGTTLYWNAVPGRAYVVEYKESLSEGTWTLLDTVTPATTDGSATDPAGTLATQRFYRVSVLPKN